jgi:multidrug efflux pump subunit AcrA (membrane-fusion protein)
MVDFNSLEVQAEVPETTLASVKIGAPARIFLDAYPQKSYRGRVDRIWPTANRQKATVEVRVVFEETDDLLRPEMGARVVFLSAPDAQGYPSDAALDGDVLFVPQAAIVRSDGQSGAFVIERDVARFRVLELGERSSDRVVVRRGLDGGERVVLNPPASLDDGDRVREKRSR